MSEELTLLPCPFCGSRDVEVQGKPAILDALDSVCCNECTADAPYPAWNTRAQLPSQGGEAVEVVGWRRLDRTYELTAYPSVCAMWHGDGYPVQALYAKPAASVPAGCKVVPVELLERVATHLKWDGSEPMTTIQYAYKCDGLAADLRALLDSAEGVNHE